MKTPCEIVVWYVLPTIRRELAKELAEVYRMRQADIGRIFGVTDAAISQYLNRKRGGSTLIEESGQYPQFHTEIRNSASRIASNRSDMSVEMCRICNFIRSTGLLAQIYTEVTGQKAPKSASGMCGSVESVH